MCICVPSDLLVLTYLKHESKISYEQHVNFRVMIGEMMFRVIRKHETSSPMTPLRKSSAPSAKNAKRLVK